MTAIDFGTDPSRHAPSPIASTAVPTIAAVQILRALAAFMVVFSHLPHGSVLTRFYEYGAFGVDIFFVISGFIMVYASRNLFAAASAPRRFLGRRLFRIVPLYWATTTLYTLIVVFALPALVSRPVTPGWLVDSYLFLPRDGWMPVNSVGWTLDYEMFFYVCFAAVIWLRRERAVLAVCVLFAAATVVHYLLPGLSPLAWKWTNPIIGEFAAGALLGLLYLRGVRLPVAAALGLVAAGALAVGVPAVYRLVPLPLTASETVRPLAWGLPALLVVAGVALAGGPLRRGRLVRYGSALGDASYGIYLIHPLLLPYVPPLLWAPFALGAAYAVPLLGFGPASLDTLVLIAAIGSSFGMLAVTGGVAMLVSKWFERPVTRYLRDRFEPGYQLRPAVAPVGD